MDIEKFVQNVKFYCEQKNVKVTPACQAAGVGTSFINNMEVRGSIPSVEKVQLLAQYLGVTTSELLGETVAPQPATLRDSSLRIDQRETLRLSVAEVRIALAYRCADQRARDMVDLALAPFEKEVTGSAG